MKHYLLLAIALFLFSTSVSAQENLKKITVSGYVKDSTSGEALIGAAIYIQELKKGTNANAYGFFSLTVNPGKYTLIVNFIGFR